jgi:RNA polymerase-binding transcription factor
VTIMAERRQRTRIAKMLRQRYQDTTEQYQAQVSLATRVRGDHEPGDVADLGTQVADSEQEDMVTASLLLQKERLETAMRRLEAGTLGVCDSCGADILPERLEIMPWATHCVPCQQLLDNRR